MKCLPAEVLVNQEAAIISSVMFSAFLISSPLPYLCDTAGITYLVGIAIVDDLVVLSFWGLLHNSCEAQIRKAATLTRVAFIIGILAITLGAAF